MTTDNLQSLYNVAAAELSKSPIFARALADKIASDHNLLIQLVSEVDPAVLATALAEYMVRVGTTNRRYDTDIWDNYRNIVRIAQDKAASMLAKDIIATNLKKSPSSSDLEKMREDITHA